MTMDIAVFSDIHSNYIAFQKCVEYALNRGINTFVFLGDYLGELAYPQRTMEMLYSLQEKYNCFFIKGNKEDYWIGYEAGGENGWDEVNSTTGLLYYTYNRLTKRDKDFFKSLSHTGKLVFDGLLPITICHGSPRKVNEQLLPERESTYEVIESDVNRYILCGHTHVQGCIEHKGKVLLNPGSVGVSLYGDAKAQFMILHGMADAWEHEFISLDYDVDKVIDEIYEDGLPDKAPYWCKITEHLLRTGEVPHGTVLGRAMQICEEKYGECIWPKIPDDCYEQAVKELIRE